MANAVRDDYAIQEKRPPVNDRQLEIMLAVLIRKETAMVAARRHLSPETFADHHRNYSAVWAIALDYFDEFSSMPPEEFIAAELESRLDQDPTALSDEEIDITDQFLRRAYAIEEELLLEGLAFRHLKDYLDDRLAAKIRDDITDGYGTPVNMFGLLSQHQEFASSIGTLTPKALDEPFAEGWDEVESTQIHKVKSELGFLSNMTNGGMARGEVLLLMGPHGSCKTTVAMQMACDQARRNHYYYRQAQLRGDNDPLRYVYVFTFEGTPAEMRLRCLSYSARIARESLEAGDPARNLSRTGNLKSYEMRDRKLQTFSREGSPIPGEWERYKLHQRLLNRNLRLVDMTGNDLNHPGRGYDMVDEIAQIIRSEQEIASRAGEERGVAMIIIDYVGASVERHLDHYNMARDRNLRYLLNKYPMHCKNKLAVAFDTPVLLLHQLSGTANSYAAGKVAKGTDAAESKTIRENTDWTLVISNPDQDGLCVVTMDKHRRAPASKNEVIQIDGRFCRVNDTDGRFSFDPAQGKIVERSALHRIGEVDAEEGPYAHGVPSNDDDDDTAEQTAQIADDFGDP